MRALVLLVLLLLAACADPHALPYTQQNAPIWNMNPSKWAP